MSQDAAEWDCSETNQMITVKLQDGPKSVTVSTSDTVTDRNGLAADESSDHVDAEDAEFENCEMDENGWGDAEELVFDGQQSVATRRHLEAKRDAKQYLDAFWKCGGCQFLLSNHALFFFLRFL